MTCRIVREHGLKPQFHLNWTSGVLTTTSFQPDRDDWHALLVAVRVLVLNDEATRIVHVLNRLQQRLVNDSLRQRTAEVQKHMKEILGGGTVAFTVDGSRDSPEDMLDHTFNSALFHDDLTRKDAEARFGRGPGEPLVSFTVQDTVLGIVQAAGQTDWIIRQAQQLGEI